jgi:hypothetical protein
MITAAVPIYCYRPGELDRLLRRTVIRTGSNKARVLYMQNPAASTSSRARWPGHELLQARLQAHDHGGHRAASAPHEIRDVALANHTKARSAMELVKKGGGK